MEKNNENTKTSPPWWSSSVINIQQFTRSWH